MTELTEKSNVSVAFVRSQLGGWIFGIYDNEDLARKRVEELRYMLPEGSTVSFFNLIVWKEKEAEK